MCPAMQHQLAPQAGDQVDHPARHIRGGQHLGQRHRRQRPRLRRQHHRALPETITGASRLTRPSRHESSGATTPTTPLGSGTLKLK